LSTHVEPVADVLCVNTPEQCGRRSPFAQDFGRRNQLPRVARGMFRRMKQESEDVGRQLRPTDAAMFEQLIARGTPELIERPLDLRGGVFHQL
jgi:hypothetical protein